VNDRDRLRLVEHLLAQLDANLYADDAIDDMPAGQLHDTCKVEADRLTVLLQLQAEQNHPVTRRRRRR
jgi:hypothetical protein